MKATGLTANKCHHRFVSRGKKGPSERNCNISDIKEACTDRRNCRNQRPHRAANLCDYIYPDKLYVKLNYMSFSK